MIALNVMLPFAFEIIALFTFLGFPAGRDLEEEVPWSIKTGHCWHRYNERRAIACIVERGRRSPRLIMSPDPRYTRSATAADNGGLILRKNWSSILMAMKMRNNSHYIAFKYIEAIFSSQGIFLINNQSNLHGIVKQFSAILFSRLRIESTPWIMDNPRYREMHKQEWNWI